MRNDFAVLILSHGRADRVYRDPATSFLMIRRISQLGVRSSRDKSKSVHRVRIIS